MEPGNIIKIISSQRHDFLNHLSVISGLVQLNKVELVPGYIVKVSEEIKSLRKVIHLKYPRAALELIAGYYQAAGSQVEVVYRAEWDFADCSVPDEVVAGALGEVIERLLACQSGPAARGGRLEILLESTRSFGSCTLTLTVEQDAAADGLAEAVAGISDRLAAYGGGAGLTAHQGRLAVTLLFLLAPEEGKIGI
ncbi:MAG: Spo0B domain-containing protein [Bacillota bacterium]